MRRIIPMLLCLVLALSLLTTCSSKNTEPEVTATPEPETTVPATPEATPTPTESAYTGPVNPLTGEPCEEDYTGIRPYAVMVNNIEVATPQSGVSQADILYECLAEGGITRMMALFQDIYDVGIIGSIRSTRPYYVDIADSYDAILLHAGGSEGGYAEIEDLGIQHIDGVRGPGDIFYRDSYRMSNMGYEHSLMCDTSLIADYESNYGLDTAHNSSYVCNLTFTEDGTPQGGSAATDVSVTFISKTTSFEYDTTDSLYYAYEYGSAYTDAENDVQLAFTNLVVLKTSVDLISGDDKGRLETVTTGTGTGWFFCGGQCKEITWQRQEGGQFVYTYADGTSVVFGIGKTYIGVIRDDDTVQYS